MAIRKYIELGLGQPIILDVPLSDVHNVKRSVLFVILVHGVGIWLPFGAIGTAAFSPLPATKSPSEFRPNLLFEIKYTKV